MPRHATRNDRTIHGCTPPAGGCVFAGRAFARRASLFLAIAVAALPLAYGQHGGAHPPDSHSSASHAPAPSSSAPHMSSPQHSTYPGPSFRGPAPSPAPSYRNVPPGYGTHPAPYPRPTPYSGPTPNRYPSPPRPTYGPGIPYPGLRNPYAAPPAGVRGPHLGTWLQSHQGQPFTSQENSLRREPGFNRLPQQQQQRLIDRLHQLDTMPPDRRQRTLGRIENMERLSPDRRQAVRGSAQELSNMDPARKEQVRGAFRVLRDMPPSQRAQVLSSPAYRSMYSDHERQVLGNLLSVEPYAPQ